MRQATNHNDDIAFGRAGQTAKARVWYTTEATKTPSSNVPLKAVTITQNGKATAFQVPRSLTLGAAAKLSVRQLRQRGTALAQRDFTQKRQAMMATAKQGLARERAILKQDQNATVVSFAAIKMDKKAIANYQSLVTHLKNTTFKHPRPLPFSVTVVKRHNHVKQEKIKVDAYAFAQSLTDTNTSAVSYQETSRQILRGPYTLTSTQPVRIGTTNFGYYRNANGTAYLLTKVVGSTGNVVFDSSSINT